MFAIKALISAYPRTVFCNEIKRGKPDIVGCFIFIKDILNITVDKLYNVSVSNN